MTIRHTWQRPETVPIWAQIEVAATLHDPSETVLLTMTDPKGTVILDEVTMDKDSLGMYIYEWTSLTTSEVGWYRAMAHAQDGTGAGAKITIEYGGFYLQ